MIPVKGFVSVGTRIGALGHPTESVEIELSLKGGQLGMPEISGQNISHKQIGIAHHKGIALGQPAHHVGILLAEHFHEFAREGVRMAR